MDTAKRINELEEALKTIIAMTDYHPTPNEILIAGVAVMGLKPELKQINQTLAAKKERGES